MRAAHQIDVFLDDRQPQPGVQAVGVARRVGPVEALEDVLARLRGDADARVAHLQPDAGRSSRRPSARCAPSGRLYWMALCSRFVSTSRSLSGSVVSGAVRLPSAGCDASGSGRAPRPAGGPRWRTARARSADVHRLRPQPVHAGVEPGQRQQALDDLVHLLGAVAAVVEQLAVLLGRRGLRRASSVVVSRAASGVRSSCEMSAVACFSRAKARLSRSSVVGQPLGDRPQLARQAAGSSRAGGSSSATPC